MNLDFSGLVDAICKRLGEMLAGHTGPAVLDTHEAAELLRVDVNTVRRWAADGVIPARKLDGVWRFSRARLIAFVEAND